MADETKETNKQTIDVRGIVRMIKELDREEDRLFAIIDPEINADAPGNQEVLKVLFSRGRATFYDKALSYRHQREALEQQLREYCGNERMFNYFLNSIN